MTKEETQKAKKKYWSHYSNAIRRNIDWEFTFDTWIQMWIASGQWANRGCKSGQYVMSRKGDVGPYSPQNVFIQKAEDNVSDGGKNIPKKDITKLRMSIAKLGKSKPKLQCQHCNRMISVSNLDKHLSTHLPKKKHPEGCLAIE